ncbi:MAG: SDR family oxidoreductase [Chryseolinea sp.]
MGELANKVVWITGASSGIGEAVAYALSKKKVRLILSARRTAELERVKNKCVELSGQSVYILPVDLTETELLPAITSDAIKCFGHIDILVNNGGISQRSLVHETSIEVYRRLMEVNFFGGISLTKYLIPHFIERRQGHFVVISSVTGKFGTPYRSGYAASKHALHGFYDAVRAEYFKDNIIVTMICPGVVHTPISLSALRGDGTENNKMDTLQAKGMPVEECATHIVRAIVQQKQEVYIGGKEVVLLYIKRFLPALFSKIIRNVTVR